MKRILPLFLICFITAETMTAQKIIPIEHNGKKYEVLDMTSKGKTMWGGSEEIELNAAKSESNGTANTKAIVLAVGKNEGFDEKPYAAKLCSDAAAGGKDDWYLPSKEEADIIYGFKEKFNIEERGTIWTSTEANGTQAFTKYWYTGAYYKNQKMEEYNFVCIRKVE